MKVLRGQDVVPIVAQTVDNPNSCFSGLGQCRAFAACPPLSIAGLVRVALWSRTDPGRCVVIPHFCFALGNDLPSQEDLKMKIVRFTLSLAVAVLLAASLSAQNVVSQWNAIASTAIVATAKEG